jgi:hypothetical protein
MNTFTRAAKEMLKDQLDKLEPNEHRQIFDIVQKYTQEFTKTEKGILVSTNAINDECLTAIQTYVTFCLDQKKRMDEDAKTRKTYERMMPE